MGGKKDINSERTIKDPILHVLAFYTNFRERQQRNMIDFTKIQILKLAR